MRRLCILLLVLAACAPVPNSGPRQLTAEGIRPGVGAAQALAPPAERTATYSVSTPLRTEPSRMTVTLARAGEGYRRTETVRIPESSGAKARIIAAMVRQRDGRAAQLDGTEVVLRARDETDGRGRTISSDLGGTWVRWDPHDCRATPGICRTVRMLADGDRDFLVVETTESGGIWRETVRRDPERDPDGSDAPVEESIYSLDESGMLIDMNRIDHERDLGSYQEIRRVE